MKSFGLINIGVLPLLLEAMAPLYGQHDQRDQEAKRPKQEQEARPEGREARPQRGEEERQRPQEARPERQPQQTTRPEGREARPQRGQEERQRPQEARPANQEPQQRARAQQEHERQQDARGRQEQQRPRQAPRPLPQQQQAREGEHRAVWREHRAENWQSQHRTWQDRGGYGGYRIPDARFRGTFGPGHGFRMFSFPLIVVGGYPRFQFGGLWFSVMDPWPEYWSDDWYGNDDMYVDYYGGGYYLRNRRHPQDRIAITVYVN